MLFEQILSYYFYVSNYQFFSTEIKAICMNSCDREHTCFQYTVVFIIII